MSERKWTPVINTDYMEANIVEGDGNILATLFMDSRTPEHAHLIAAAPGLYEANEWLLKTLLDVLAGKPCRDADKAISFAKSSAAKARGEAWQT